MPPPIPPFKPIVHPEGDRAAFSSHKLPSRSSQQEPEPVNLQFGVENGVLQLFQRKPNNPPSLGSTEPQPLPIDVVVQESQQPQSWAIINTTTSSARSSDFPHPQRDIPYCYKPLIAPLKQIRILNLLPGAYDDPIVLSLTNRSLAEKKEQPYYEALSYVWGSTENKKPAFLVPSFKQQVDPRHSEELRSISITNNLEVALRHLRDERSSRQMWIDAVCINQSDDNEKGSQVSIMADIYREAHRVVMWLGPEADDSSIAMYWFDYLSSQVDLDWGTHKFSPASERNVDAAWADRTCKAPWTKADLLSMKGIFLRPWFERLWIKQEAFVANNRSIIVCGHNQILWSDFQKSVKLVAQKLDDPTPDGLSDMEIVFGSRKSLIDTLLLSHERGMSGTRFGPYLESVESASCFDPRDRIYSLITMYGCFSLVLKPDYTKPVLDLYTDVTASDIALHQDLTILRHAGMKYNSDQGRLSQGFPSWVRDWRRKIENKGLSYQCASGHSMAIISVSSSSMHRRLHITGMEVATIGKAWPITSRRDRSKAEGPYKTDNIVTTFGGLFNVNELGTPTWEINSDGISSNALLKFCQAISGGLLRDIFVPPDPQSRLLSLDETMAYVLDQLSDQPPGTELTFRKKMDHSLGFQTWIRIWTSCNSRKLFQTTDGKLGLGPLSLRVGDSVAILTGAPWPCILRPTCANRHAHQFVGDSYMHDFAWGEAWLGPYPAPYRATMVQVDTEYKFRYLNTETGESSSLDPRIVARRSELTEEEWQYYYMGKRALPDLLRKLGVPLKKMMLV